jgi:hypothetical protein
MGSSAFGPRAIPEATALALVAALALPAAAATAVRGTLNVVANSTLAGSTAIDLDSQSWVIVPEPLDVVASAEAMAGADSVDTGGLAEANWGSADSGSVFFFNYGWDFHVSDPTHAPASSNLTVGRGGDDWTYTFVATRSGEFRMTYSVAPVALGEPFGLWGWAIDWSGPGGGLPLPPGAALDPTASGVFARAILAGQTYTIGLNGNPNIAFDRAPGDYSGHMDGEFRWKITDAVVAPEPDAWALMITGLGSVGAALRRRRGSVAA